ncbi:hypothetical protein [Nocardioides halotolerans]|uniref:hypothetical protein n=1 Tax=Nocardioides halotolerans TaxID=433660 RepID=UPI000402863B|nr:hypothetical protein [Nocardioides halotolerans]
MMIGHLGDRVSALLDGQMAPAEEERAWSHVHTCHQCRDLVEREGWVKTRLAGLSFDTACAPSSLKGSLLSSLVAGLPPGDVYLAAEPDPRPRRVSLVALGGGAAGAAVMGVLALGAAPADAPTVDRRVPSTSITTPVPAGMSVHQRRAVPQP